MRKFLKSTWPVFLAAIVSIAILYAGKRAGYEQGYSRGYTRGFSKGLDTAAALNDRDFDSLMTKMREDYRDIERMLADLQAHQAESF